jgi:hypothetical protein
VKSIGYIKKIALAILLIKSARKMKIIIDGVETLVKVNDEFLEGTFLETLYEWLDSNEIDIEFEEE